MNRVVCECPTAERERELVVCRIRRLFRRLGRVGWTLTSRNWTPTDRNRTPTSTGWTPTGRNRAPTSTGWAPTGRNRAPTSAGWRLTIVVRTLSHRDRSHNDLEPTPKPVDRRPNLVDRCPLSPGPLRNRPLLAFSVALWLCGSVVQSSYPTSFSPLASTTNCSQTPRFSSPE